MAGSEPPRLGECGHPLSGQQRKWCSDVCSKAAARATRLATIFNLTVEDYEKILEHQNGVCAICLRPPKEGQALPIDHDHRSGFVRGALCTWCNLVLISKHRDPHLLFRAAEYLADPPARRALGRDVVAPGRPKRKRRSRRRRVAK